MQAPKLSLLTVPALKTHGHKLLHQYMQLDRIRKDKKKKMAQAYIDLSEAMHRYSPHFAQMDDKAELIRACHALYVLIEKRSSKNKHHARLS
jgi:hypothetical protein